MLFAHVKRQLGFERLRLRGLSGARDEFHLAATVQNLRRLARLAHAQSLRTSSVLRVACMLHGILGSARKSAEILDIRLS